MGSKKGTKLWYKHSKSFDSECQKFLVVKVYERFSSLRGKKISYGCIPITLIPDILLWIPDTIIAITNDSI